MDNVARIPLLAILQRAHEIMNVLNEILGNGTKMSDEYNTRNIMPGEMALERAISLANLLYMISRVEFTQGYLCDTI